MDLILERAGRCHVFECKLSKAPKPSRGFYELVNAVQPESAWVIAPVDDPYEIKKGVTVCPLTISHALNARKPSAVTNGKFV